MRYFTPCHHAAPHYNERFPNMNAEALPLEHFGFFKNEIDPDADLLLDSKKVIATSVQDDETLAAPSEPAPVATPSPSDVAEPVDPKISIRAHFSSRHYVDKAILPPDFEPSIFTVTIGRGRIMSKSAGNYHLERLVRSCVHIYDTADTRTGKSAIVTQIIDFVRELNDYRGSFIRLDAQGRYWEVSEIEAREKIGTVFRNFLQDRYRSSVHSRMARRKNKRLKEIREQIDPNHDATNAVTGSNRVQPTKYSVKVSEGSEGTSESDSEGERQIRHGGVSQAAFMFSR